MSPTNRRNRKNFFFFSSFFFFWGGGVNKHLTRSMCGLPMVVEGGGMVLTFQSFGKTGYINRMEDEEMSFLLLLLLFVVCLFIYLLIYSFKRIAL